MGYGIDIIEQDILTLGKTLLDIILKDRTTNKNIIWATNDYAKIGDSYEPKCEILSELITKNNTKIPRITKELSKQSSRTKTRAEVFTPSWVCNLQNNLVDDAWFGRENVFNAALDKSWVTSPEHIMFPSIKGKTWKDYINANRLEITCGEAPYLASRYDTVTGEPITLENRIGLLDRKLRIINENTDNEADWLKWTQRAFESIYGYEFQGDSLLLARESLLFTFIDNMEYKLKRTPTPKEINAIGMVISWNIWQMDGLKYIVPLGEKPDDLIQISLFEEISDKPAWSYCKIKNWRAKETIEFRSLLKGEKL